MRRLAVAALVSLGGAAQAQTPPPGPVWLGVAAAEGGGARLTFVFGDAARPDPDAPVASYAVQPSPRGCGVDYAAAPVLDAAERAAPAFAPAMNLPAAALPALLGDLAVERLRAAGWAQDAAMLRGAQICVRRLWERIVGLRR